MQENAAAVEREASARLPDLLAELLDEPRLRLRPAGQPPADLLARDRHGRRWAFVVKSYGRPGQVSRVAEQTEMIRSIAIPVLVVPFMSEAGAEAADKAELNWIDLSGNAHLRAEGLHVWLQGRPNEFRSPGRPSSPFAPKSARIARTLLLDPSRWWRQKELVEATRLDDGNVSRIVRRLEEEWMLERREREFRPRNPGLLLDAWAEDYRFDRHDAVAGHVSGSGIAGARRLAEALEGLGARHAFTGLPAAWALDHFARFRLTTVYVEGDPHAIAERLELRRGSKGANVRLLSPNDDGVFAGEQEPDGLRCVSTVQVYLDLLNLPERAEEAAHHLRSRWLDWHGSPT